ncbi:MAG: hypothetical protein NXI25_19550 [bacterium]|nr:hypothetical protein [bacterium]
MKDFILTALLAISLTFQSHFVISQTHFPDSIFNQGTCNSYNLTLSQMGEENTLYPYFYEKERKDRIKIHPFSIIEIGGWQAFTASLVQEEEITFEHISTSKSRFFNGQYYRYQQFYQGVPVLGGGFNILIEPGGTSEIPGPPCEGCPPPSPCALVSYISAHIFENIDIDVTNTNLLAESQLNTILSIDASQLRSRKLSIAHDMAGECTYKLVWKVDYQDSQKGDRIGWIDNETGVLLSETSKHNFHNAPTADYGIQFLDDQVEGDEKILKNNRLTAYDLSPSFGDPGITKIENTSILFGGTPQCPNDNNTYLLEQGWIFGKI